MTAVTCPLCGDMYESNKGHECDDLEGYVAPWEDEEDEFAPPPDEP